jgi:hypothetical protein
MQSFERSLEPLDLDPGADLKLPRELVDEISGDGMVCGAQARRYSHASKADA